MRMPNEADGRSETLAGRPEHDAVPGPPVPTEPAGPPGSDRSEPPATTVPPLSTWGEDFAFLLDRRYLVLSGVLVVVMVSYLFKHTWPGAVDIWEHAAAARELGAHPLHPDHPLLAIRAPHQYFSPYLLVVGLMSRFTGLTIVETLDIWGVVNLVMILVGLRLFVTRLIDRRHVDFYALVFMLFLWGPGAWFFSGFLHFDIIAFVLTYPSTFVKGLVFLSLWAHLHYLETDDRRWLLPTLVISFVVILTHPIDQAFLAVGLVALTFTRGEAETGTRGEAETGTRGEAETGTRGEAETGTRGEAETGTRGDTGADTRARIARRRRLVLTVGTVAVAFGLALLWPYMSVWQILFGAGAEAYRNAFKAADHDLYVNILARCGLALIVIPFVVRRSPNWRRDPLVLMFLGTLALYVYGLLADDSTFGRLISSVQVVGAIILADERTKVGEAAAEMGPAGLPLLRWVQYTTLAIVVAGMFFLKNGFIVLPDRWMEHVPYGWSHSYVDNVKISDFDFLAKNAKTYPVVMSDLYTSLEIPTFGPKVVDFARAQAFVDTTERGNDLARFYDVSSSVEIRRAILDKYHVAMIVVPIKELTNEPARHQPLIDMGRVVSRNSRFVFVDVRPT
ncbi:MAG: hypothetical protein M3066_20905 [Actinomycetota bacterium]|nr:hypothetical protein [Actinomycetota bacterium]